MAARTNGVLDVPDAPSDAGEALRRSRLAFAGVALLAALDMLSDAGSGIEPGHVVLEGLVLVIGLAAIVMLSRTLARARGAVRSLRGQLAASRAEAERWRRESRELLEGLGAAIDDQFERWALSPAEREVGLLLVKGLSLSEIAGIRNTSERTVRQQAQGLYRKAGLAGRAELSAFFLEELLLPGGLSGLRRS